MTDRLTAGYPPGSAPSPGLQQKLKLGAVDDPSEKEADRVADAILRERHSGPLAEVQDSQPVESHASVVDIRRRVSLQDGAVQRQCAACETEEEIQRTPLNAGRMNPSPRSSLLPTGLQADVSRLRRAGGRPLDASTRTFMEPRFGRDFSHVRVHAGSEAGRLAEELHARAFTVGSDVFFGRGQFVPKLTSGRRLLAHELTHTVQQTGGSRLGSERAAQTIRRAPIAEEDSDAAALAGATMDETEVAAGGCPRREPNERAWARAQPLVLDYDLLGMDEGYDIRKWVLSGFPVDWEMPGPEQGDVTALLLPVFKRLKQVGTRSMLANQSHRKSRALSPGCYDFHRVVRAMGTGDCHAPELNKSLKVARAAYIEDIWPASLKGNFLRSAILATRDEANFGEFPAKSNATKEARAKNRGVVLIEGVVYKSYDKFRLESELVNKRDRVALDFHRLFDEAVATIGNDLILRILKRARFDRYGRPLGTYGDAFISRWGEVELLRANGSFPPGVRHVGERIFEEAVKQNVMSSGASAMLGDVPSICGEAQRPTDDPVRKLRQIMLDVFHEVQQGVNLLNMAIERKYEVGIMRWRNQNEALGGIYLEFPPKPHFLDSIDYLNPARVAGKIMGE